MINKLNNIISRYENVIFVYLFGSYSKGSAKFQSDIDIGVYFKGTVDLLNLGRMISEIEKVVNKRIDLIELNDLYKKNPQLSYEVVTKGSILFCKNDEQLTIFKRRAYQYYFDTINLRKSIKSKFYQRISSKRFGKRNYA